jgi:hypothetical protein
LSILLGNIAVRTRLELGDLDTPNAFEKFWGRDNIRISLLVPGRTVTSGLYKLTGELMELAYEFGGRVNNGYHSTPTAYEWLGENLLDRYGLLENKVKTLRKAYPGLDFTLDSF